MRAPVVIRLLCFAYLVSEISGLSNEKGSKCEKGYPIKKASLMRCFGRGQFGILALRNKGETVFAPELSDDYQVYAISVEASLYNCSKCQSVHIQVYGKLPGGKQELCASQPPNQNRIGSETEEFAICDAPISVVGFHIRVQGLPQETEHLVMNGLSFFYKMYMTKGCDSVDRPFPFIPTNGAPCVLPFMYEGIKTYDCVKIKDKSFCGSSCQPLNNHKTAPLVECLTKNVSPLFITTAASSPLIIMSSRANVLGNVPFAAVDRKSASDPGLCLSTKDSERKALRGLGSELNWIVVDLGVNTALRLVRLWQDQLPLKGVEIWVMVQPPKIQWSQVRKEELVVNNTEGLTFCGSVSGADENRVVTVPCLKETIGRWVLVQKKILALSICELEFYKDDSTTICYASGKPTTDCQWKKEAMTVHKVSNGTFETVLDKESFYMDYILLSGTANCVYCKSTIEVYAMNTSSDAWDIKCSSDNVSVEANKGINLFLRLPQYIHTTKLRFISSLLQNVPDVSIHKLISRGVSPIAPEINENDIFNLRQISKDFLNVTSILTAITTTQEPVTSAVDTTFGPPVLTGANKSGSSFARPLKSLVQNTKKPDSSAGRTSSKSYFNGAITALGLLLVYHLF